jgi:tRNA A-37 threonylcarbamoyl transferase component Bud32
MELDIEDADALRSYLAERGHTRAGEPIAFDILPGGVSNRTVRVTWPDGQAWVLKQALAKLRVSVDWFSSPNRIEVEARALRRLNLLAPAGTTPAFVFEDQANHLLAMQAIPAEHENWKSVLLSGRVVLDHFEQSAVLLSTIHRRSSEAGPEIRQEFSDTSYFESLRLEPYYLYAAEKVPEASDFLTALARETLIRKISLVHGDFSPKNILIYNQKLILLDYEVVHFGDPAFDLGFVLAHFLSKAHHLRERRAALATATSLFWTAYLKEIAMLDWSGAIERQVVSHALACLLARVAGKSPLEYLTFEETTRQRDVILFLIGTRPAGVQDLVHEFIGRIESHAKN